MDLSRREFIGKKLQVIAALAVNAFLPKAVTNVVENITERQTLEPNPFVGQIVQAVVHRKEQEYLRAYLDNPKNTKNRPPRKDYVAARIVDGQPKLHYYYAPQTMWLDFRFIEGPRAIKYLKKGKETL